MKTKVSAKQVLNNFGKNRVVCFGYCQIQGLENYLPQFATGFYYTKGVYGWNADVYTFETGGKFFAICTGYRPFGVYDERLSAVADKYEKKYQTANYNEKENVTKEFINELWATLQENEKK